MDVYSDRRGTKEMEKLEIETEFQGQRNECPTTINFINIDGIFKATKDNKMNGAFHLLKADPEPIPEIN